MSFKIFAFAAIVSAVKAGVIGSPIPTAYSYSTPISPPLLYSDPSVKVVTPFAYSTPLAKASPLAVAPAAKVVTQEEYDSHPQYSFAYNVQDGFTGDNKQQQEIRDGDIVQGSYSLVEPDGTRRIVQYIADAVNGFNAIVNKEPLVPATPVVGKTLAPLSYTAQLSKVGATSQLIPQAGVSLAYAIPAVPIAKVAFSPPIASYYH